MRLGASGSIEAAVVVEAMRRSQIPPNVGLVEQDPEIPLTNIVRELQTWGTGPGTQQFVRVRRSQHRLGIRADIQQIAGAAHAPATKQDTNPPLPPDLRSAGSCTPGERSEHRR